jgi:hypothetical protein
MELVCCQMELACILRQGTSPKLEGISYLKASASRFLHGSRNLEEVPLDQKDSPTRQLLAPLSLDRWRKKPRSGLKLSEPAGLPTGFVFRKPPEGRLPLIEDACSVEG